MDNVTLLDHPILRHKLGFLRNKETNSHNFRDIVRELSSLIAYEVCRDLSTHKQKVQTVLAEAEVDHVETDKAPIVVSILRAGNGMLESILDLMPYARAGHIGIYRDKFIGNTVEYYFKIPENSKGKTTLLLDPLLATGDTAVACIDRLKQYDLGEIRFLTILASRQGAEKIKHFHPDVKIYAIGLEEELNDKGYLVPGIGDAGDRLFQTK